MDPKVLITRLCTLRDTNDQLILPELEKSQNSTFITDYFDVKPAINEIRRSPRLAQKSTSQIPQLSEYLALTSENVLLDQVKSEESSENETVANRAEKKKRRKTEHLKKTTTKETEKPFGCSQCDNVYQTKNTLVRHMRKAHPAEAEGSCPRVRRDRQSRIFTAEEQEWLITTEFKCAEFPCENISFSTYPEWLTHQQDKHQLGSKLLEADIDNIKFPQKHTNGAQPCPRCGKRLYGPMRVLDHIRIVHLGEAIYPCEICGKSLSNKSNLEKHKQNSHSSTPLEKYLCALCGAEFKSEGCLRDHARMMHNSVVNKFHECHICKMKFIFRHRLKDHIVLVHSKPSSFQFICDFCGKGFMVKNHFRSHRIRHVQGASKDEVCELCGKAYSFKKPLMAHLMTVHKLSPDEARKSARLKTASRPRTRILSTGEVIAPKALKPVNVCTYCGRRCARRDLVFTHLMSVHGISEEEARSLTQLETKRKLVTGSGHVPIFQKITPNTTSSSITT